MSGVLWKFYIFAYMYGCILPYVAVLKLYFFKVMLHMILKLFNGMLFTVFFLLTHLSKPHLALMKISDHHSFVK